MNSWRGTPCLSKEHIFTNSKAIQMKTEDYKRGIRAMNDLRPESRAAFIVVLNQDGNEPQLTMTTLGEPKDLEVLIKMTDERLTALAERLEARKEDR